MRPLHFIRNEIIMSLLNNKVTAIGTQACLDALDASINAIQTQNQVAATVVFLSGAGVPVDGTTGLNVTGKGSLYFDTTNSNLYINSAVSSATVWKLVTRAA